MARVYFFFFAIYSIASFNAYSARAEAIGRFDIKIVMTVVTSSNNSGGFTWKNIYHLRSAAGRLFTEEMVNASGAKRKNKGAVYDINSTVNCSNSEYNPVTSNVHSDRDGTTSWLSSTCRATSSVDNNTISLNRQYASVTEGKYKAGYGVRSEFNGSQQVIISYDISRRSCNLASYEQVINLNQVGIYGSYPDNSDSTRYSVANSTCTLTPR